MKGDRYEYEPYPWPVKLGTLALLGLPVDATCDEFEERWRYLMGPIKSGDRYERILFIRANDGAHAGKKATSKKHKMKIKTSGVEIVGEAPNAIIKEYAAIVARNSALPYNRDTYKEKGKLARMAAAIFASDIEDDPIISSMTMEDAIKAADYDDPANQVGLLSGTLVLQRALPLMMWEYPMLETVFTDFSDAPGLLNQTETTRIVLKPAVQSFNTTPGADGRTAGWNTVSPAQTVDVPITLSQYLGVPVVFGSNTLESTIRNLFQETAQMALYSLGGAFVNMLTALFTAANYNAYAGATATVGITEGENTATAVSTADMYPGQYISGTGIPANTFIVSIQDATDFTMSAAATATNAALAATLGTGKVPTPYATYAQALANFSMADLALIGAAFDNNEVPQQGRYAMLNAAYHAKLAQDPSFNTFWAAMHAPDVITKGRLPELQGLTPQKAPYFPTSNNRVGFAYHKAAAAIKSRLPQNFLIAVNAKAPGSVTTVTAPGGFSVLLVQYINLTGMYAEWRPEVLLGAAVGERRAGLVLTSQ